MFKRTYSTLVMVLCYKVTRLVLFTVTLYGMYKVCTLSPEIALDGCLGSSSEHCEGKPIDILFDYLVAISVGTVLFIAGELLSEEHDNNTKYTECDTICKDTHVLDFPNLIKEKQEEKITKSEDLNAYIHGLIVLYNLYLKDDCFDSSANRITVFLKYDVKLSPHSLAPKRKELLDELMRMIDADDVYVITHEGDEYIFGPFCYTSIHLMCDGDYTVGVMLYKASSRIILQVNR